MRDNQRIEEEFNDSLKFDEFGEDEPINNDLESFEEWCIACGAAKDCGEPCFVCGCDF